MKQFRFSLEKVLEYKQESVDGLRVEYGVCMENVRRQEAVVRERRLRRAQINEECREKEKSGMPITEARMYAMQLEALEREIAAEQSRLTQLRTLAEQKREEMVAMRQEASAIDKLREKKLTQYRSEVQKSEEKAIDDLVCARLCCR